VEGDPIFVPGGEVYLLTMNKKLFDEGVRLEKAGELEDAAVAYQRVVDADPGSQEAVGRLVVVYRKLKEYGKELRVIDAALEAVEQRDKEAQQKWIKAHPGAARLGKEVLRTLGGERMTAYGTDPMVEKLLRRKAVLEKTVGGKKKGGVARRVAGKKGITVRQVVGKNSVRASRAAEDKKKKEAEQRRAAKIREKEAKRAARAREREEKARAKAAEAQAKRAAAQAKKVAAEAKAAEARARREAAAHPSLFVVTLRYLVPLEKIDAMMEKHVAFLDKHYAAGDFLASGRLVPRTGGIIIARGKSRAAVEKIMKQDPFQKGKLASFSIVEFVASKMGKGLKGLV